MNLRKSIPLFVAGALAVGAVAPAFAQGTTETTPAPAAKSAEKTQKAEKSAKQATEAGTAKTAKHAAPAMAKVDLNAATKEELMKLPGVTDATANKILAGRPYASKEDLEKKQIVSKEEYSKLAPHLMVKAEPKKK